MIRPLRVLPPLALAALAGCPTPDWGNGGGDDDDSVGPCEQSGEGGAVDIDEGCMLVMPYEEFDPVELIEWQWSSSAVDPDHDQVMMTPIVIQLSDDNNDGVVDEQDSPDVVFNSYAGEAYTSNGRLRAVSGDDGTDLWTVSDPAHATAPGSGLAAGDLDGDGMAEIVAITDDGEVMLVEHDGAVHGVTLLGYAFGNGTHPAVADLEGDGAPEILIGRVILDGSAGFLAEGGYGSGDMGWGPMTFAADVTGNGFQEVVADNAVYRPDGSAVWAEPAGPTGFPAVADFDLDGDAELVVVSGGSVYLFDAATGAPVWGPSPIVNEGRGGPPTVADYDGDGYPEIGVAGLGAYTVLDTDGSMLWWNPTEDDSSNMTGSAVFDFNGDGVAEVVYADEHALYVYEGPTGTILFVAEDHASGTLWENPVIVDIDHDFSSEIVLASNNMWWEGWTGITVLGAQEQSWYPARGVWNQHAYSITNIEDDGTIPAQPEAPWVEYNSFRQNTLADDSVLHAPNLYTYSAAVCDDSCPDQLTLLVRAANAGLADVSPGLGISVWAVPPGQAMQHVTTEYLPEALPSGTYSAPLTIALDPSLAGAELSVTVDVLLNLPEGLHDECDEEDNGVTLTVPPC